MSTSSSREGAPGAAGRPRPPADRCRKSSGQSPPCERSDRSPLTGVRYSPLAVEDLTDRPFPHHPRTDSSLRHGYILKVGVSGNSGRFSHEMPTDPCRSWGSGLRSAPNSMMAPRKVSVFVSNHTTGKSDCAEFGWSCPVRSASYWDSRFPQYRPPITIGLTGWTDLQH